MQEEKQLLAKREVEEILNEFFGDRPIPERTAKAKHLIRSDDMVTSVADTVVSLVVS